MSWEDLDVDATKIEEEKPRFQDEEPMDDWETALERVEEPKKKKETKPEKKTAPKPKKQPTKKNEKKVEEKEVQKPVKEQTGMMKNYQKKLQELQQVSDLFDASDKIEVQRIDLLKPQTAEDYDQFATLLANKILESKNDKENFIPFLKKLIERSTVSLKSEEMREISKTVNVLVNQKIQEEKEPRKKSKKPQRAALKVTGALDVFDGDGDEDYEGDDDDFM